MAALWDLWWRGTLQNIQWFNWGSVADWMAGIGTVAAFGIAAGALVRDHRLRQRSFADNVSVWILRRETRSEGGRGAVTQIIVTAHVFNGNTSPIPYGSFLATPDRYSISNVPFGAKRSKKTGVKISREAPRGLAAGKGFDISWTYDKLAADAPFIVRFQDNSGQIWFKSISSGKYVSEGEAKERFPRGFAAVIPTKPNSDLDALLAVLEPAKD